MIGDMEPNHADCSVNQSCLTHISNECQILDMEAMAYEARILLKRLCESEVMPATRRESVLAGHPDDEGQGGRTTNNLGVASVRPPSWRVRGSWRFPFDGMRTALSFLRHVTQFKLICLLL